MRYGRDFEERWTFGPGNDRGFGNQGYDRGYGYRGFQQHQRMGYDRGFASGYSGFRGYDRGYDARFGGYDRGYMNQGGGRGRWWGAPDGSVGSPNYGNLDRMRLHDEGPVEISRYTTPWGSPMPGMGMSPGLGYGMGRGRYIYK